MPKHYDLGDVSLSQYANLTEAEKEAWLHPAPGSYHSFHVERMGTDVYRWRNSRTAQFSIGTFVDLQVALHAMHCRKVDPDYANRTAAIRVLSQNEIDEFLGEFDL